MSLDLKKTIYMLHPLERKVLPHIDDKTEISEIEKNSNLSEDEVNKALLFLEQRGLVQIERNSEDMYTLDSLGIESLKTHLPEIELLRDLDGKEKPVSKIKLDQGIIQGAIGILKREGLVEIQKENELIIKPNSKAKEFLDKNKENPLEIFKEGIKIKDLKDNHRELLDKFKLRKGFIKTTTIKSMSLRLTKEGKTLSKEIKENFKDLDLLESLTTDMLKEKSWEDKEFRHYQVNIHSEYENIGKRHPMIEANNILRDIFVEMGFKEMEGPMVETAFWNMDTMWIPQDHPARDEQDTFYLEGEGKVPKEIMEQVKEMHEVGIKKSHTMVGDWSENTTKRRLLRTHSTATTFRTLAMLGEKLKKGENVNGKYFYVANNFRNEAIDATHLAEFYQAEGFIIADDLSLADLMGFIKGYYGKLGIDKIKFKPTYNPYTEPSMEAHYYDGKMKKWYALINSGIFREETLKPLGLSGKRIIAWGMGASRVATLLAGVDSMRDITGATCDLEWMKRRPLMKREIIR